MMQYCQWITDPGMIRLQVAIVVNFVIMPQWRQISVPPICERAIGFSVPSENKVLVISYEGTHLLNLGASITVETDESFREYDIYDHDGGTANYRGKEYIIIGLYGSRESILRSPQGEMLVLDTTAETLSVLKDRSSSWQTRYENFSGDWAAATFSPDGHYIVLGCPYDFDFRVFERMLTD